MDARIDRSRSALRDAVLELAAAKPIGEISASEICRVSGVTRDTFYRHFAGPTELLADALGSEIQLATGSAAAGPAVFAIGDGERHLFEHVSRRAAIYRGAMAPSLAAPIRARLDEVLCDGLADWVRRHPEIVPDRIAGEAGVRMAVAYAAAGTIGAIEHWLRSGTEDVEAGVDAVLAASPEWWLTEPSAR